MNLNLRLPLSLIGGWIMAGTLLIIGFNLPEREPLTSILLWNVKLFVAFAGDGPLLGYDSQGNPMYEGTPVHIFFALIGIASSFIIYPIFLFLIFTLIYKMRGGVDDYRV